MDFWLSISFLVAKEYNARPMEVYTKWESREVLIAYGIIMNNAASENLASYEAMKSKKEPEKPEEYAVKFITHGDIVKEKELLEKEELFNAGKAK